jgi:CBS domain-containing protein
MVQAPMKKAPSTVRDLMAPRPSSIDRLEPVVAAARRMRASGLVSIPVTGDSGQFLGMLSDRDIVEQCVAAGLDPATTSVGSIFQPGQSTIPPDRIVDAAVMLQIAQYATAELPVVEGGLLVGMLSIADVAIPLLGEIDGDGYAGEEAG